MRAVNGPRTGWRLLAAASLFVWNGAALASSGGGGGGGMGSMPSVSAPQYDVVQEYQQGVEALGANRYKDAERAFSHVLEVSPRDLNSLYMTGLAKAGEKDAKGASRFFERALKVDPQHIGSRRQLAIAEASLGQTDKAQGELDTLKARASACGDTCPDAAELKAATAAVAGALSPTAGAGADASGQHISMMFASPQQGDQVYQDAVRLINLHRYVDALAELQRARAAFGPHPDILTYIGYVNRKLGRLDVAESYYKQVFALDPDHVGATEYYGELKVERGDMPGARQMLARLDTLCTWGCVEQDDLRRWIVVGHDPEDGGSH
jgi:tetratricopeptide (TPR) repeat protein